MKPETCAIEYDETTEYVTFYKVPFSTRWRPRHYSRQRLFEMVNKLLRQIGPWKLYQKQTGWIAVSDNDYWQAIDKTWPLWSGWKDVV